MSYPGNQLYVVSKTNTNQISLTDFISNSNSDKDPFISLYWKNKEN